MNKIKIKTAKVEIKEVDKTYPIYLKKYNQIVEIFEERHTIIYYADNSVHVIFNKYEYPLKESDLLDETNKEDFEKTLKLLMDKFDYDTDFNDQM